MDFGKELRNLRKNKGLTLKEVATELKIGVSSLSDYENNNVDIPMSKYILLMSFYNIEPINFLLCSEEYLRITNYSEVGKKRAYLLDKLESNKKV